eukprot:CAMPEP_0198148422 /NCGR_PEP_ID=MMETSP1443-20131203/41354_1 /TAXON_ID=186043 /ORGANISM="Entomoneis sp., Strain CCMP2396" /LENGTH=166 /DNA_ID=CAMNT_0043813105 /DNA_START=462 /DNA_END=965 /DNA_ORIENTATION=-
MFFWMAVLVLGIVHAPAAAAAGANVDPGDDFQGYMQDLEKKDAAAQNYERLVNEHELWRQTTWSGFAVRQLQAFGNHFAPFFKALADIVADSGGGSVDPSSTPVAFLLTLLIRVLVISAYILAAYAVAKIINSVFGREIVIEEEIVIIEEDEDEDDEDGNETKKDL